MGRLTSFRFHQLAFSIFNFRNAFLFFFTGLFLISCTQENLQPVSPSNSKIARVNASPTEAILTFGQVQDANVTVRMTGGGYLVEGRCAGFIPAGEYAGHRFKVTIGAEFSGLGATTLVSGTATIKIQSERFESVYDEDLVSFCCGEGYLYDFGDHFEFTVHGQVEHNTASIPHNHLFAGLGSTLGFMNFNIADQTGSITEPEPGGPPPHDPGIGLIIDIPAHHVTVEEIPL